MIQRLWPQGLAKAEAEKSGSGKTYGDLLKAGKDPCAIPSNGPSPCQLQNVSHFQFFFSIGQTF